MGFFSAWLARGPSTALSRYTGWNGVFYVAFGLTLLLWPGAAQTLFMAHPYQAGEAGLARALGFTVAVIGYFYVFGARTGATSFGLATVVDRALVPLVMIPLALTGAVDAHLALPLGILDPLLGLGALLIWRRSKS